jgi:hypothetical protein
VGVKPGDIVFAYILDPDGNPCHDVHPVMVFRATDDSVDAWVVGITSKFQEPIPTHWLRLPWHPNGHPVTGLYLESVLKCNWVHRKLVAALGKPVGVVPPNIFERATDIIAARAADAAQQQRS